MKRRRRFPGIIGTATVASVVSVALAILLSAGRGAPRDPADLSLVDHSSSSLAPLRSVACPFPGGDQAAENGVECWMLTVPERHADPNSRTLDLAVAVLRRTNPGRPETDPVLFLSGGPGQGALVETAVLWAGSSIRDDHDLVLIDQRGTGYGSPSLQCPELEYHAFDSYATLDEAVAATVHQGVQCRDRLIAQGIDLTAYDTVASAADIERLRHALGIARWNLYGVSYGTRLALEVMRSNPDTVRSAVLDSVLPPDVTPLESEAGRFDRSLDLVIAGCAADAACAAAYGGAAGNLGAVMTIPNGPVDRHWNPVLGFHVTGSIVGLLADPGGVAILPAVARAVELDAVAPFRMTGATEFVLPQLDAEGLFYAIECRERIAFADPQRVAADRAAHPRFASYLAGLVPSEMCTAWDLPPVGEASRQPVVSDVPTLILAGTFDPTTPPEWGRQVLAMLPNGFLLEFPDQSHWVTQSGCGIDARNAFIADPTTVPVPPCLAELRPAFATDIVINAGLERLESRLLFSLNGPTPGNLIVLTVIVGAILGGLIRWPQELLRAADPRWSAARWARVLGLAAIGADALFAVGLAAFLVLSPEDSLIPMVGITWPFAAIIPVAVVGAALAGGLVAAVAIAGLRRSMTRRELAVAALLALGPIGFSTTLVHYGVIFG